MKSNCIAPGASVGGPGVGQETARPGTLAGSEQRAASVEPRGLSNGAGGARGRPRLVLCGCCGVGFWGRPVDTVAIEID